MKKAILMIFFITQIGGITMAEEALTNNKADYSEFTDNELIKKNPKLTPTQAAFGALKVVRALSQGARISPELVKAQTGIVLRREKRYINDYNYYGDLNDDWSYMYQITSKEGSLLRHPPPTSFEFKFLPRRVNGVIPARVSICEIDLGTINATIRELGFTYEYEDHGYYWQSVFKNDNYYVRVAYVGGDKKKQNCMMTLEISEREIKK